MSDIHQSLFLKALRREPVVRTPIWLMRQAGRYLPEYRETRQKAGDFMSLCKNPELACEVTLQPLRRFALDAAILFSDILTIPDAMGLGLYFEEGEGPKFQYPLKSLAAIEAFCQRDISLDLNYVMSAVRLIRREMPAHLPLIGFSGSPWTLACYVVEGGSSADFMSLRQFCQHSPNVICQLLDQLTIAVTNYLSQQVEAGVNALMIFDTWGGLLTAIDAQYQQFSLSYIQTIVQTLKAKHPEIPILVFSKGAGQYLKAQAATGCDGLSLDSGMDLGLARKMVGSQLALQGNLDPKILLTDPKTIEEQVLNTLKSFGSGSGHIFNLGHGVTPEVPPEHVACLVDAVHRFSPQFHGQYDSSQQF